MKTLITAIATIATLFFAGTTFAATPPAPPKTYTGRNVLNDPDLFFVVTPDRMLNRLTRDEWLSMSEADARIYWDAWNCKERPCDTPLKAEIRMKARLVPRTRGNFGLKYRPEG